MLAGLVDLVDRNVRSDMALLAGVRLARHFDGKLVARVAGRAGAERAVQVHPPHSLVGPAVDLRELELAGKTGVARLGAAHLEPGAVAVVAGLGLGGCVGRLDCDLAVPALDAAQDRLLEVLVELVAGQVLVGMRHDVAGVLLRLLGVAGAAVPGADHDVDVVAVVLEGVGMLLGPQRVALGTADHGALQLLGHIRARDFQPESLDRHGLPGRHLGMATFLPVLDDARMKDAVALDARLSGVTHLHLGRRQAPGKNEKADGRKPEERFFHNQLLFMGMLLSHRP